MEAPGTFDFYIEKKLRFTQFDRFPLVPLPSFKAIQKASKKHKLKKASTKKLPKDQVLKKFKRKKAVKSSTKKRAPRETQKEKRRKK